MYCEHNMFISIYGEFMFSLEIKYCQYCHVLLELQLQLKSVRVKIKHSDISLLFLLLQSRMWTSLHESG